VQRDASLRICQRSDSEQRLEDIAQAVVDLLRNGELVCAFIRGCNLLNPRLKEKEIACLSDTFVFGVCIDALAVCLNRAS